MDHLLALLRLWMPGAQGATFHSLGQSGGLSGARLWRVDLGETSYVLREWPGGWQSKHLEVIHRLQAHLASDGLPTPRPLPLPDGSLVTRSDLASSKVSEPYAWSLVSWMPGVADYHADPRPEKLRAALAMLARIHLSAARFQELDPRNPPRIGVPPLLVKRLQRLEWIAANGQDELRACVRWASGGSEHALAKSALQLVEARWPAQLQLMRNWAHTPAPLQWRLGDVTHDHILFTGNEVSGVIDFGAACVDAPAGDVARLLSSLVEDDAERWRAGLEAYESIRKLTPWERDVMEVFNSSGAVVAAANWISWLWPAPPRGGPAIADRDAALARLATLVEQISRLPV